MDDGTAERERSLRQLVLAGSSDPDHYIELADLLYRDGRSDDALAILKEASGLELPPRQRAVLLNEQAQFLFQITGAKDEARVLAEQALSILRQHPPTPDVALAEIYAENLVAKILWETNRPEPVSTPRTARGRTRPRFSGR